MVSYNEVKQNTYYDSVTLMLFSSKIISVPGVKEAAVMMGTNHNKSLMINSGILKPEDAESITPNDMVVGIMGETQESVDEALKVLKEQFERKMQASMASDKLTAKTLDSAVNKLGDPNFAVISIPGKYAKNEAMKAMQNGMHVLLFSDNVTIDEENELKDYAVSHNLLMMGPDCGTAIINGIALGFANVVRRGNIGIVAAAGTGLQEATVIVDRLGGGISQALGTGGRDVKEAVNGKMMVLALEALINDPDTEVIGIISKPPAECVMEKILNTLKGIDKPVVACFLGGNPGTVKSIGAVPAETLEDAAAFMVDLSLNKPLKNIIYSIPQEEADAIVANETAKLKKNQKYIRGLYSGGTLCYESMLLLNKEVGEIYSNIALDKEHMLKDVEVSQNNTLIDMGEDYFTDGAPHPMIDIRQRAERLKREVQDESVAVIILDCVLGYGSHEDPAGALVAAIREAKELSGERHITFIASVCGTGSDIQNREVQEKELREAGVIVMPSNAQASRIAAQILGNLRKE